MECIYKVELTDGLFLNYTHTIPEYLSFNFYESVSHHLGSLKALRGILFSKPLTAINTAFVDICIDS